jgi:hypothetical protein
MDLKSIENFTFLDTSYEFCKQNIWAFIVAFGKTMKLNVPKMALKGKTTFINASSIFILQAIRVDILTLS